MPLPSCDCHTADVVHAEWCRQVSLLTWPWRNMVKLDNRIGLRLDERMAQGMPRDLTGRPRLGAVEWALRLASLLIVLLTLSLAGFGAWLFARDFFFLPFAAGGLVLLLIAFALRPRFGRLKPLLHSTYLLRPERHPATFGLLHRMADAAGTRMPDVVGVDDRWNAMTAVVGLRRKRVLVIGLPLWAALQPQERVALLAHEFGHLVHEDSLRTLLAQPALTTFGRLARAIRPPGLRAVENSRAGLALLVWQVVGGLAYALLWTIHIGFNVAGFREVRRSELHADLLAVKLAGNRAAASVLEVSNGEPMLAPFISAEAETGRALPDWHAAVSAMRERKQEQLHALLHGSVRADASLFAPHPPAGIRHGFIAGLPQFDVRVTLIPGEAERIDRELAGIAEHMLKLMKQESAWS